MTSAKKRICEVAFVAPCEGANWRFLGWVSAEGLWFERLCLLRCLVGNEPARGRKYVVPGSFVNKSTRFKFCVQNYGSPWAQAMCVYRSLQGVCLSWAPSFFGYKCVKSNYFLPSSSLFFFSFPFSLVSFHFPFSCLLPPLLSSFLLLFLFKFCWWVDYYFIKKIIFLVSFYFYYIVRWVSWWSFTTKPTIFACGSQNMHYLFRLILQHMHGQFHFFI
jgi:hypothetical protein